MSTSREVIIRFGKLLAKAHEKELDEAALIVVKDPEYEVEITLSTKEEKDKVVKAAQAKGFFRREAGLKVVVIVPAKNEKVAQSQAKLILSTAKISS